MAGIHKIRTTPYHPRGNPVERFNRTLLDMLGTLADQDKTHWKDFVKPLVHAYNCTKNDVTGFSPYELMFGRQPRLPVDLAFGLPVTEKPRVSHSQYVQDLKSHLKESYELATGNAEKVMKRNKARFDRHVTASELAVGDRVLVRNVRLRGKRKLADKWESEAYIVVKRAGTLPVYTVRPETKDGPLRTLHRDLLLPCGYLPSPKSIPSVKLTPRLKFCSNLDPPVNHIDMNTLSDDDEVIPNRWYSGPPRSELARFTTIVDIPTDSIVAPSNTVPTTSDITHHTASDNTNQEAAADVTQNLSDLPDTAKSPEGSVSSGNAEPGLNLLPDDAAEETAYSPIGHDLFVLHVFDPLQLFMLHVFDPLKLFMLHVFDPLKLFMLHVFDPLQLFMLHVFDPLQLFMLHVFDPLKLFVLHVFDPLKLFMLHVFDPLKLFMLHVFDPLKLFMLHVFDPLQLFMLHVFDPLQLFVLHVFDPLQAAVRFLCLPSSVDFRIIQDKVFDGELPNEFGKKQFPFPRVVW
ncbi:uncharacterized protein LOC129096873 [Anoplopoma fimbria]|uniref:uncharacterized protein LOC129096873 n=1 Tax=Anoplopoma fimbria TaxID=229290 RepID=UPI0023EC388A|nr:uncharacterized protein LOC129096873 [Anoplopoma fimbria]